MERVKIGEWKTVFQGKLFTVKQAKARLPNGKMKVFEKASRTPSVAILAFDNKNRLILIREYRSSKKKYRLGLPSGRVDPGETPLHAAKRELAEETGFYPKKIKLFYKTEPAQSYEYVHFVYLATNLIPRKIDSDEYEDITSVPTTLSKAYKMVKEEKLAGKETMRSICKLYWNKKIMLKKLKI